jgi:hypothetical protein
MGKLDHFIRVASQVAYRSVDLAQGDAHRKELLYRWKARG